MGFRVPVGCAGCMGGGGPAMGGHRSPWWWSGGSEHCTQEGRASHPPHSISVPPHCEGHKRAVLLKALVEEEYGWKKN